LKRTFSKTGTSHSFKITERIEQVPLEWPSNGLADLLIEAKVAQSLSFTSVRTVMPSLTAMPRRLQTIRSTQGGRMPSNLTALGGEDTKVYHNPYLLLALAHNSSSCSSTTRPSSPIPLRRSDKVISKQVDDKDFLPQRSVKPLSNGLVKKMGGKFKGNVFIG
jgi:hypothetical protein